MVFNFESFGFSFKIVWEFWFWICDFGANYGSFQLSVPDHYHSDEKILSYRTESITKLFSVNMFSIKLFIIIFNFSELIFLNFNLIPIVKVSVYSNRLPENIIDFTLRAKIRYKMNTSHLNCLRLNFCQESQKTRDLSSDFLQSIRSGSQTDRPVTLRRSSFRRSVDLWNPES